MKRIISTLIIAIILMSMMTSAVFAAGVTVQAPTGWANRGVPIRLVSTNYNRVQYTNNLCNTYFSGVPYWKYAYITAWLPAGTFSRTVFVSSPYMFIKIG